MALAELTDIFQNTTLGDTTLLFRPRAHARWSELELSSVPDFLFRVYTPESDGLTNEEEASSRGAVAEEYGHNEDIFATETLEATAQRVADHLWWAEGGRRDNLVSWSSSILFLIRYVFYRHYNNRDGSSFHDIRLLIIDTKKFPAQTFIRDLDLISAFERFDIRQEKGLQAMARMRKNTNFYFGEYLSQGSLHIGRNCNIVSAQAMIDRGLLDLRPLFKRAFQGEDWHSWAKSILTVREAIKEIPRDAPAPLEMLDKAFDIARHFGRDWRFPVAVHLLALLPHVLDLRIVYERLWTHLELTSKQTFEPMFNQCELTC